MDEYTADKATTAVRVQLARKGMNQAQLERQLERQLGVGRGTISRALASSPLDDRSKAWPAMLEALGLEIIIRPKQDGAA